MGEHKLPKDLERMAKSALPIAKGPRAPPQIKRVENLRIERVPDDAVCILMIGDQVPELGIALDVKQLSKLGIACLAHANALKKTGGETPPPDEELPEAKLPEREDEN